MISSQLTFVLIFFVLTTECEKSKYQLIEETYKCDPNCWFRESVVSTETISKWPINCTEVCGILSFDENSDIPVFELQPYFENLRIFKGRIDFIQSKYASIDFLSNLNEVQCDIPAFYVNFIENPNLEQINFGNLTNVTCDITIFGNRHVDVSGFCEKYEGLTNIVSNNNLKNCPGCAINIFYTYQLEQFKNCTSMSTELRFNSFRIFSYGSDEPDFNMSEFANIQNLTYGLNVLEADFRDLTFFKSLEVIKGRREIGYFEYDISIKNCYNLTRFGMPKLKQLIPRVPNFRINVESVHSDFCFTTSEFKLFLDQKVVFANLAAKICANDTDACVFKTMKDLEQNCSEILGNVTINAGDEIYTDKLKNVKNIWGFLTINNTTLTDLSFLGNLEYVALLSGPSIPIQIKSNKLLNSVKMPSLKRVFSKSFSQISLENSGDGFLNSGACLDLMENTFETNVVMDGKLCGN